VRAVADVIGRYYRLFYGATALGVLVTVLSITWLQYQPPVYQAELRTYDTMFSVRGGLPVNQDIVVVGLDDTSVKDLAQDRYPLPRRYMARAINFLHRAHARAIGLDFEYFNPSLYGPADDRAMGRAIKRAGNVVLEDVLGSSSATNALSQEYSVEVPIPAFARYAAGIGVAQIAVDPDNVTRWTPIYMRGPGGKGPGGRMYPTFTAAVAAVGLHKPLKDVTRVPTDMYINWVGQQRPESSSDASFTIYQLEGLATGEDPYKPFRNKFVLIVPDLVRGGDLHETSVGQMYGGFVQANILNTLLRRIPITPAPLGTNNLVLLVVGLISTLIFSRFGILRCTAGAVGMAALFLGLAEQLFIHFSYWINVVTPEITIVLVYALIMALRFSTEERVKRRLKSSFGLYLKPEIVEVMAQSRDADGALAAARREVSCLFVDIRGFTSMSEKMQPEDVVRALDVYLEELTESVQEQDGMINKYVGDELIGVWNCLQIQPQPDHALRAVKSGLDMVKRMERLNSRLTSQGLPAVRYGIGINSGEAVVGQMGSSFRKQYDVIGDTMNTAARLCSAAGGGEVIISEDTWRAVGDRLVLEETEPLSLKGKSEKIRTFIVLSMRQEGAPLPAPTPALS
jgi:adenylate cyclase